MNLSIMHIINGKDVEFGIVNRVSISKMEAVISFVVENVFPEGIYMPARFDYYLWLGVIATFTDFDVSEYSQDELYDLFDDKRFTDKIRDAISQVQFERIEKSARELIEIRLNKHPLDDVCAKFTNLLNNINENINNLFKDEDWANEVKEVFSKENIGLLLQYIGSR